MILCRPSDSRMFPFQREAGNSILPVGNIPVVERTIRMVKKQGFQKIYVLAQPCGELRSIAEEHGCQLTPLCADVFCQVAELADGHDLFLMDGEIYLEEQDVTALVGQMGRTYGVVLGRAWREQESGFGAAPEDDRLSVIYGHPRDHYVDTRIFGVCVLPGSWTQRLSYTAKGGGTVNCGQMPDQRYHLETALNQLIQAGMELRTHRCSGPVVPLCLPWDLFQANQCCCQELNRLQQDSVGKGSWVKEVRRLGGVLQVGENCVIRDVTFEGNCVIGDHVTIEAGAVIGKNCIIGSGSVIRHHCLIHDNTVIGPGNKVDFGAELCGVTMEGVAAVHTCEVYGVIGRSVDIAAGVIMGILRFDDMQVPRKVNGRTYRSPFTNCVCIGDYTRTGVHTTYMPGVSVGARCAIGPGVLVEKDVPSDTLLLLKQERTERTWGSNRYGW